MRKFELKEQCGASITHQESMDLAAITGVVGLSFDKLAVYAAQIAKEHSA
jgi:hypothetical protein